MKSAQVFELVMPGLVPGIHVCITIRKKDVDGRDKPGHDGKWCIFNSLLEALKMLTVL